jgi:hypothetical protein
MICDDCNESAEMIWIYSCDINGKEWVMRCAECVYNYKYLYEGCHLEDKEIIEMNDADAVTDCRYYPRNDKEIVITGNIVINYEV